MQAEGPALNPEGDSPGSREKIQQSDRDFSWSVFWRNLSDADPQKDYARMSLDELWHVLYYWIHLPWFHAQKDSILSREAVTNGKRAAQFIALAAKQGHKDHLAFLAGNDVFQGYMMDALKRKPIDTAVSESAWHVGDFLTVFPKGQGPTTEERDRFGAALAIAAQVWEWVQWRQWLNDRDDLLAGVGMDFDSTPLRQPQDWERRTVGPSVHLRDVLTVLHVGNPDTWEDRAGGRERNFAYNLVQRILRDRWEGPFDPSRLKDYAASEAWTLGMKRITGLDPEPPGGENAATDAEIRRLHNAGLTQTILQAVRTEYPDVARATGLDKTQASMSAAVPMTDATGRPYAPPVKLLGDALRDVSARALPWQRDIAGEVHRLTGSAGALDRWRKTMREWAVEEDQPSKEGLRPVDLYEPLLFMGDGPLSLRAEYVLLAAIHDAIMLGLEQIQPWGDPMELAATSATCPDFGHRVRYELIMRGLSAELADKEAQVRAVLEDVKRDLAASAPAAPPEESPANVEPLDRAILDLIERLPLKWEQIEPDTWTATEAEALRLLTAAGMVERRLRIRLRFTGHSAQVHATITATGEYGLVEAIERVAAEMQEWYFKHKAEVGKVFCEKAGPEEARLSEQGDLARHDCQNRDADGTVSFVRRRGFGFSVRPSVRGWGRAESVKVEDAMDRQTGAIAVAIAKTGDVTVNNTVTVDLAQLAGLLEKALAAGKAPDATQDGRNGQGGKPPDGAGVAEDGEPHGEEDAQGTTLPDRVKAAYAQYLRALSECPGKDGRAPTDRECYDWLKAHNDGDPLPAFETWQRYVRQARQHHGQQKNAPRAGRQHGSSIVSAEDVEPTTTGEAD